MTELSSISNKKLRRPSISPRVRLKVMQRDSYTCKICGQPGGQLEIDHITPFSKGGGDNLENYQTLCFSCNRGKSNDESLNRTDKKNLDSYLNYINPDILKQISDKRAIWVIVESDEYKQIEKLNSYVGFYQLCPDYTCTIIGYGSRVGPPQTLYTRHDKGGSKVRFQISIISSSS